MKNETDLLTIGETARALGVTRRILLHYEERGLIQPDVRRGDGGTLRLPKQDVHDALTRYEFAAAAEGEDYVLSYRERGT